MSINSNDPSKTPIPQRDARDAAHTVAKGLISLIPIAGSSAAELFSYLIMPSLEKRREEWFQTLAEDVQALQEQQAEHFKIDGLQKEEVITTILEASRLAIATHQEEKRKVLRNAVLNAVLPGAPDETRQKMFIQWVGELTAWHLKILELFESVRTTSLLDLDSPTWGMDIAVDELSDIIEGRHPELKGQHGLYIQIVRDLHRIGLIANLIPELHLMTQFHNNPQLTPMANITAQSWVEQRVWRA